MKARLAWAIEQQRTIAKTLRAGTESVPVEVHLVADYEAGVVREIRTDTAEVLLVREVREAERQMDLP